MLSSNCKRKCSQPFFRSQFKPKKTSPRQASSISSLHRELVQAAWQTPPPLPSVRVKLGCQDVTCDDGRWIGGDRKKRCRNLVKMNEINNQLEQDNCILQLKNEILLDMLAETTAKVHYQENEIKQLRCAKHKF